MLWLDLVDTVDVLALRGVRPSRSQNAMCVAYVSAWAYVIGSPARGVVARLGAECCNVHGAKLVHRGRL